MDTQTLQQIRQARQERDEAEARMRRTVVAAATADDTNITAIAEAAGVMRKTVYRWMAEAAGVNAAPEVDPVTAMDQALTALLAIGAQPAHEVHAGLGSTNRGAKARRLILLVGNLDARHVIDDEQQSVIDAGVLAAHRVQGRSAGRPRANDVVSGS